MVTVLNTLSTVAIESVSRCELAPNPHLNRHMPSTLLPTNSMVFHHDLFVIPGTLATPSYRRIWTALFLHVLISIEHSE
jgi:hypothetical protein